VSTWGERLPLPPRARRVVLGLGLLLVCATVITHVLWGLKGNERLQNQDIYNIWEEGQQIIRGINPYARIVGRSVRENDDYPTYLPLSYLFAASIQWLGAKQFEQFMQIWRPINLVSHLCLAWMVVNSYLRKQQILLSFVAASILTLGRWSAYIIDVQHLEFTAISALIGAGLLINRRPAISAFLLGLSLSIKHVGVILVPAFLIQLTSKTPAPKQRIRELIRYVLLLVAIPALISVPFIATSPVGFLLNMLFSASRLASSHGPGTGSHALLLGLDGARLFLFALLAVTFMAQAQKGINFWTSCTFSMLIILQFNPVVFGQYFIWLLSIGLIAASTGIKPFTSGPP
jgi:uncharacterized membrane protein